MGKRLRTPSLPTRRRWTWFLTLNLGHKQTLFTHAIPGEDTDGETTRRVDALTVATGISLDVPKHFVFLHLRCEAYDCIRREWHTVAELSQDRGYVWNGVYYPVAMRPAKGSEVSHAVGV